jgi:hypothetical protein
MAMADGDTRFLLHLHQHALETAIAANRAYACDAPDRFVLDGLTARLVRLLVAIERDLSRPPLAGPFGTAGRWGPNGRAPEIEDLIRRSACVRAPGPAAVPHPAVPYDLSPASERKADALPHRVRTQLPLRRADRDPLAPRSGRGRGRNPPRLPAARATLP